MNQLYLLLSLLSAIAFYLASPHQQLWPHLSNHHRLMRTLAWLSALSAIALAIAALGIWAGVFSALTAWMFASVSLPYLDAWRRARKETSHVG